jgi:hypothetical protein
MINTQSARTTGVSSGYQGFKPVSSTLYHKTTMDSLASNGNDPPPVKRYRLGVSRR